LNPRLYVGNLDYGVTSDQLKDLFSKAGTVVSATVITRKRTGRSKGFGFVEMSNVEEAQKAIEMFDGQEDLSRKLSVAEAQPRETEPSAQESQVESPAPAVEVTVEPEPAPSSELPVEPEAEEVAAESADQASDSE